MKKTNLTNWPSYSKQEIHSVEKVLSSNKVNYWTGSEGRKFEEEFSSWSGTKYSIALANGTVALDLALKALDIKSGDYVLGDIDGVVIIPQDIAESVVSETEDYMNTESQLRKDILSGVDPKEAYLKYRVF